MFGIFKASKGFHYYHGGDVGLQKQPLSKSVAKFMEDTVKPHSKPLSKEDYWFEYGKYFHSAVKSSYIVYEDTAYWALDLGTTVFIGFKDGQILIHESEGSDTVEPTPQYDAWDAIMEGQQKHWNTCSKDEIAIIDECMGWTEKLHNDLNDQYPMEKILSGDIKRP